MLRFFRRIRYRMLAGLIVYAMIAVGISWAGLAVAQQAPPASTLPAGAPPGPQSNTTGASVAPTEISRGNAKAIGDIGNLFSTVITTAVTASQAIKPQADKFAFGLAVITIVLGAIKFSAAHHPVTAWVALFEELAVLGIFAGLYTGYQGWAPGFYTWFTQLAQSISGASMTQASSVIGTAAGQLYDGFILAFKSATFWQWPFILNSVVPLFLAWLVLSITSIVFLFFINVGQLQAAVGFVMGQIALALGFSSFTRGYFKSWLDYMTSAGMYIVVAAALTKLVTGSLTTAIQNSTNIGLTTPLAAAYVFDMSVLVFLLSFEIPKMAAMFGGGASASGAMIGKVARAAASAV
jgi:hypothetical protein